MMYAIIFAIFVLSSILNVKSFVINQEINATREDESTTLPSIGQDDAKNGVLRKSFYAPNLSQSMVKFGRKKTSSRNMEENNSLESAVLALNNGFKDILKKSNLRSNFLDKYAKKIVDYLKGNSGPLFRAANEKYNIKPEVVNFRHDKPTLKIEINPKTVAKMLRDFLESDVFVQNFDKVVQQAAILYRALHEEPSIRF